jgi:hypothetical protein
MAKHTLTVVVEMADADEATTTRTLADLVHSLGVHVWEVWGEPDEHFGHAPVTLVSTAFDGIETP